MIDPIKYIHDETAHNLRDPQIIVPVIIDMLNPQSVVDLGCGIGTFLHIFEEYGIKDILGLDGKWVDKFKLSKNLSLDNFKEIDIENDFVVDRKFDLAICLEVMEHINADFADKTIKKLTELSDVIIFSAAIPGQMGQNHINEQWTNYWEEKFRSLGYIFHDVFRPIFWNNEDLSWWYKQNMFLVVKQDATLKIKDFSIYSDETIKCYVHPECFTSINGEKEALIQSNDDLINSLKLLVDGRLSLKFYIKILINKLMTIVHIKN